MNPIKMIKHNSMLYVSFNQDNSFFSIGTETGFLIYQTFPFIEPYERKMDGGIGVVEMLYKSNYLALMGGGRNPKYSKNKLIIWDDHENKIISELKFTTSIINIKLKEDLLFVVCQKIIYIFDLNVFEVKEQIETGDNKNELIAINNGHEYTVLAYPSLQGANKITIKNYAEKTIFTFTAQDDSVSKININNSGKLIASSNENGTIIRIHSSIDGMLLQEFKRGHEKAKINCICFDNDSKLMAISSSRGTIHIFSMGSTFKKLREHEKMKEEKKNNNLKNDGENRETKDIKEEIIYNEHKKDSNEKNKDNNINNDMEKEKENIYNELKNEEQLPENTKTFFGGIFGSQIEKSFAKVRIKSQDSICAFAKNNILAIISSDNKYYLAEIDNRNGGDCKIILEANLIKGKAIE